MKGFTLVELMVAITILMLFAGVGLVSLNNFNARQKIQGTKEELVSNLKLARNYATTMQLPEGLDPKTNALNYIQVNLNANGQMTTVVKDAGTTYFSKDVSPNGVTLSFSAAYNIGASGIRFSAYKGSSPGGNVEISISSNEGVNDTQVVNISSSGLINEK